MTKKKPSFEESLKKLEAASEKLKRQDVPLEEAIRSYREGLQYYEECRSILDEASAEIETLTRK
ncbi:MAG: exodeoxyribonuclease VII small subunit [Firmicutes bacterium]|nr:exodeoxyribonuclease VII small subunit [Bacillota bacterium]